MAYFFDTYAIIELINNNPSHEFVKDDAITTSVLNIGELYSIMLRQKGKELADSWFSQFQYRLLEITPEIVTQAVYYRYSRKKDNISLTDAVGYVLAKKHNLKFLTGDSKFDRMKNVEFVK